MMHYDKLYIFYRKKYKRPKKVSLILNLTSVGLTSLGTVLAPFASLFTLRISIVCVLLQSAM